MGDQKKLVAQISLCECVQKLRDARFWLGRGLIEGRLSKHFIQEVALYAGLRVLYIEAVGSRIS